ncbi:1-aminocyclopropane-1-carboxylate oxidase homolog 1-like [Triticum urartu]|uniref:1-aminocyclopropane-1-carboxylate oxidase homolog 1-like n=1 Tax=Triticum urartu TaxID=4572 RepID=UPI0020446166|nr:1-aminocyclopropane-1-carboxylate oxidase homolog 1-like [Triticum urartu]XP_048572596.1 1-aminocyclopropane-1-carboxylate oxidase homolog 1-like [Triticum urartu]
MASDSDRLRALKAFDNTKASVKGLVDTGVTTITSIFHHPLPLHHLHADHEHHFTIPVINLAAAVGATTTTTPSERAELVTAVKVAAEMVGFFQVVNHGVPKAAMSEMLAALRGFHEEPAKAKAPYYSRDSRRRVRYHSNFDLFRSPAANWHDTLFMETAPESTPPDEIPPACRTIAPKYMRLVQQLGRTLLELLSKALGLRREHLEEDAACLEGLASHYYPSCPEPHLTLGTTAHSDPCFLTVVLQDAVGGFQVLVDGLQEDDKKMSDVVWVDVPAVAGVLVVNVGDFLQLVSNSKFRSVEHRMVAKSVRPRVFVACFFRRQGAATSTRVLQPIVTNGEARYRSTTMAELVRRYRAKGLDSNSLLQHLRL